MNQSADTRTEILFGASALQKLKSSRVIVFGLGGVGSFAAEALARGGVGSLTLVDSDFISITNINRQLIAVNSTIGMLKTEAAKKRYLDINPDINITALPLFFLPETVFELNWNFDYVIDAVDTVAAKVAVITEAKKRGIPAVSVMGAGNKTEASMFEVADIYQTSVCPLAKIMRKMLRSNGIGELKVVYSKENPRHDGADKSGGLGSAAYVTGTAGLIAAGEAIKDIIKTTIRSEK
ncbi:MAG: tRNA threonylcarbamoyladenosine dehydratase [Defluviitaleaceae bacterium]|nr:tRNA threonylcarbamoyladenosine dehydratase [Defluviitaleaceae bacterium]